MAGGGDFNCLRQLNKVTSELVPGERIVLLAEKGMGGSVFRENSMYKGGKPNSLRPKMGKTLVVLECGARKD